MQSAIRSCSISNTIRIRFSQTQFDSESDHEFDRVLLRVSSSPTQSPIQSHPVQPRIRLESHLNQYFDLNSIDHPISFDPSPISVLRHPTSIRPSSNLNSILIRPQSNLSSNLIQPQSNPIRPQYYLSTTSI